MRRDALLLAEMIEAASRAIELVDGVGLDALRADKLRQEALLWTFTVLGEASAQVSVELKDRHPNVGWSNPSRLRNRIVHGYWSIDLGILHATATEQLPEFVDRLRPVLSEVDVVADDEDTSASS